ncbi:MAG: hypothetical protein ACKOA1_06665 [Bacteroidota bacterium]
MNTKKIALGLSLLMLGSFVIFYSCQDDENTCIGGSGGQLTIVAKLKHHGEVIANLTGQPDTVWIKYNVQEWSNAPLGADARIIGEEGEDHIHLEGLKCGKYYLYGSGFDTTYQMVVRGGIPLNTSQTSGELLLDIPVTE